MEPPCIHDHKGLNYFPNYELISADICQLASVN